MSLIGFIKGYIAFGRYLYCHKNMFLIMMTIVFLFVFVLFSKVYFFPKSVGDLQWDEFYIDRIIERPRKSEYRALYGYSSVENKRVFYRQYDNVDFYKRVLSKKNIEERSISIGWAYISGPWWGSLDGQRMLMEVHYQGEKIVDFNDRYNRQYPRTKKVVIVSAIIPVLSFVFCMGAFFSYLAIGRCCYVK